MMKYLQLTLADQIPVPIDEVRKLKICKLLDFLREFKLVKVNKFIMLNYLSRWTRILGCG